MPGTTPLVAVFVVVALIGSANAGPISDPLSGIDPVIRNKSCFTGPFSSHKSWGDDLAGRNQEFNRERFEQKYPREKFEHYRASLVCRFFAYKVDEYEIGGFLVAPRVAKNVPAIIFNRGGTATFGQLTFAGLYANVFDLAAAGYVVIGSQYRGGMGKPVELGGKDEWGGGDVDDVMALFQVLDELAFVDPERIGMYGGSRGSVNMFQVARKTRRIKALVSAAGVYDLEFDLEFRPAMEKVYAKHIPGFNDNRDIELANRSVIKWVDQLDPNVPILILHGAYDKRTSAAGALKFASRLQARWHPYRLIIFENDDHFFSRNAQEAHRVTVEWFKRYL